MVVVERHDPPMTQQLTTEILSAALENLTARRHQIDEQIAEVRRLLGGGHNGASAESRPTDRKHRISAAGRRAIAAAQRQRWAEQKAAAGTATTKAKSPKRKLSPEGRQAIVDALKKRWAAKRAAASAKKPAAKKAAKAVKVKAAGGSE
jgi:hypothetical protein